MSCHNRPLGTGCTIKTATCSWLIELFHSHFEFDRWQCTSNLCYNVPVKGLRLIFILHHAFGMSSHIFFGDKQPQCHWSYFLTGAYALNPHFTYFQRRQPMKTTQQMTGHLSWTSVIRLEQQPMGKLERAIFRWILMAHFDLSSPVAPDT